VARSIVGVSSRDRSRRRARGRGDDAGDRETPRVRDFGSEFDREQDLEDDAPRGRERESNPESGGRFGRPTTAAGRDGRGGRRGRGRPGPPTPPVRTDAGWDWPEPDRYFVDEPDVPLRRPSWRERGEGRHDLDDLDLPTFVVEPSIGVDPYPFSEPPPGFEPGEDPFPHAPRTWEAFSDVATSNFPAITPEDLAAAEAGATAAPETTPAHAPRPEHLTGDERADIEIDIFDAAVAHPVGDEGPAAEPGFPFEESYAATDVPDGALGPGETLPRLPHVPTEYPGADQPAHEGEREQEEVQATGHRIFRNTAIFSVATGLSRVAGLVREVVASSAFGTGGPASAFTIAFQVPNLVRGLFADAALSAAFVPVFTDLLEQKKRREAAQLATTLLFYIVALLGALTAFFILAAGVVMPIFVGTDLVPYQDLVIGLSQVLFPIVVLLGVNGLVVGILNAYDHFTIPAIAPLVWNFVIIAALVILKPYFHGENQIYAYAVGVLIGTVVQLAMSLPMLRRVGFHFSGRVKLRDPRVKQVFVLMLPVTLALGVINFDLLINSSLGSLVSDAAPRAIDAAFRIYMLPQGVFSVALATVLFPALSRLASRKDLDGLRAMLAMGSRQIYFALIPAAVFCAVLATPIVRLVYERGAFDAESTKDTAQALFWFSFSLPFAGVNLLLTRSFFSLQRPWYPTVLAAVSLVVNGVISLLLYKPLGIAGLVIGTAVASAVMTGQQMYGLRKLLHGQLEVGRTLTAVVRILIASAALGAVSWVTWDLIDGALGTSLPAQIISVGMAMVTGLVAYIAAARLLRIQEMTQIEEIYRRRRGKSVPA
jgi:putative peptidoglycan lipid II flippase